MEWKDGHEEEERQWRCGLSVEQLYVSSDVAVVCAKFGEQARGGMVGQVVEEAGDAAQHEELLVLDVG